MEFVYLQTCIVLIQIKMVFAQYVRMDIILNLADALNITYFNRRIQIKQIQK